LLFRQLTRKAYQNASAVSETSRPSLGSGTPLYELDGGIPVSKHVQLRGLPCSVTALERHDSSTSSTPYLVPRESNLSPSQIPPSLSPRCLDVHVNSGNWVPSPNARTKRPATGRDAGNQIIRTLVPKSTLLWYAQLRNKSCTPRCTFAARCRSSR
jgi:hypothetical protein